MDDSPSYDATDKESDSELDSLYDALKKHDDIRFATYRTAAKLRYIQRKAFLHHIDIWNMIEAFRENGLNTLEPGTLVNRSRLETLLASLYSNLNKRLPPGQSIDIEKTSCMLSTWLMFTYCSDDSGRLRVFSVKIAMAVLSCGKLMDKFRYMFSQLNDCNGHLSPKSPCWTQFLKDILRLPAAVGERQTFNLNNDSGTESIFDPEAKVTVNEFLETMMSDPGPHCVSWLLVIHRITAAEGNFHPVTCSSCHSEGFPGLRYKSDSANYHLCQMCFWRGDMSEAHRDDVFKEYSMWKTPGKPSGLRRSMRCVPQGDGGGAGAMKRLPKFPDRPEPPLNLANIVPASPLPAHNGFSHSEPGSRHVSPAISGSDRLGNSRTLTASPLLPGRGHQQQYSRTLPHTAAPRQQPDHGMRSHEALAHPGRFEPQGGRNEEHDLIARYANRLASSAGLETSPEDELGGVRGAQGRREKSRERGQSAERKEEKNSRRLVHELEMKNAEIMREIARLRQNRATVADMEKNPGSGRGAGAELESLRMRKVELEFRLNELQETRKDLMCELEELMKVLKVQGSANTQATKFSQMPRANHPNISTKLRAPMGSGGFPPSVRNAGLAQSGLVGLGGGGHGLVGLGGGGGQGLVGLGGAGQGLGGHQTGLGSDGVSYERSPGDTNNSESGDSQSMPASVTSLSE